MCNNKCGFCVLKTIFLIILITIINDSRAESFTKNGNGDRSNNQIDSIELLTSFGSDNSDNGYLSKSTISLEDQIKLLSKQMDALIKHRQEDYKILETNLKKSVKKNSQTFIDSADVRAELEQLRSEIKAINRSTSRNKERLTIEWLSQSMAELRLEIAELQSASNNITRNIQQRNQIFEDILDIKGDMSKIRLEMDAIKLRNENNERIIKELKAEAIQSDEDIRRSLKRKHNKNIPITIDYIEPEADHRLRHYRFIRQQIQNLEMAEQHSKRQWKELQHHHIAERLEHLEIQQNNMANSNFNLSRQVASLDRLHGSMLELLEYIENLQMKVDKTLPEIQREISKIEINSAQITSEQNLLHEENHNTAKSLQAMAVSVSSLQEYRDQNRMAQKTINVLEQDVEKLKLTANTHKDIVHSRIEKIEFDSKLNKVNNTKPTPLSSSSSASSSASSSRQSSEKSTISNEIKMASEFVKELETVEKQYETIINKLPNDCSGHNNINNNNNNNLTNNGIYMIAPIGQRQPIMTQCIGDWTTIQKRFDGSIDFNRSWNDYANGFGQPNTEYWIGNDNLHYLTIDNCTELRIIMQDIYDNVWEANYKYFHVGSRESGYRLTISGYMGNASDALEYQNNMKFSAIDVDNDISNTHCAGNYEGGWWFSHCQHANLNGRYNLGLTWFDASRNEWIAVKNSQMMIKKNINCMTEKSQTTHNQLQTNDTTISNT